MRVFFQTFKDIGGTTAHNLVPSSALEAIDEGVTYSPRSSALFGGGEDSFQIEIKLLVKSIRIMRSPLIPIEINELTIV